MSTIVKSVSSSIVPLMSTQSARNLFAKIKLDRHRLHLECGTIKTPMKSLGEANLTVKNPSTGDERIVTLIRSSCRNVQNMGLITMNNDRFIANVVVQEIGDLGMATLQVNDEVKPKSLPCRKLPLSLQDDVKREIDNLVERNVLVPVTEPTEWVSQMAVVRKANGKL